MLLCGALVSVFASDCAADEPSTKAFEYQPPAWPNPPNTGAMLLRLAAATGAALALCLTTLYVLRRRLRSTAVAGSSGTELRILDSIKLDHRCTIHLLAAGDKQVLIGLDGSGLKTVVPLPESFTVTLDEAQQRAVVETHRETVPSAA